MSPSPADAPPVVEPRLQPALDTTTAQAVLAGTWPGDVVTMGRLARRVTAAEAAIAALTERAGAQDFAVAQLAARLTVVEDGAISRQDLAQAIADHLALYPPPPAEVDHEELADLVELSVSLYVAAHVEQLRGPAGHDGAPGRDVDPAVLAAIHQAQAATAATVAGIVTAYDAGAEVRQAQFPIPLLALGGTTANPTAPWPTAFPAGSTVRGVAISEQILGRMATGYPTVTATPTGATVALKTSSLLSVAAGTGWAVGFAHRPRT